MLTESPRQDGLYFIWQGPDATGEPTAAAFWSVDKHKWLHPLNKGSLGDYFHVSGWEGPISLEMIQNARRIPADDRVKLATRTEAPVTPEMIARFSDPKTIRIFHYIAGLVTEAGEALDQLKKHLFYGKELDVINLKEELGDTDWYMNLACSVYDTNMKEIEEANIKKLAKRYGDKFSQDAALIRDLTEERKVLEDNLNG